LAGLRIDYVSGAHCATFFGQGPQHIIFSALEGQRQNYEFNFRESRI